MANLIESFCKLAGVKTPANSGAMLVFRRTSGDSRVEVELLPPSKRVRLHLFSGPMPNGMLELWQDGENCLNCSMGHDNYIGLENAWLDKMADTAAVIGIPDNAVRLMRAAGGQPGYHSDFAYAVTLH